MSQCSSERTLDVNAAVTEPFWAFLQKLQSSDRLDGVILDGAHLLLTGALPAGTGYPRNRQVRGVSLRT